MSPVMCSCGRMECLPGTDLCEMCEREHYERTEEERDDEERADFEFAGDEIPF